MILILGMLENVVEVIIYVLIQYYFFNRILNTWHYLQNSVCFKTEPQFTSLCSEMSAEMVKGRTKCIISVELLNNQIKRVKTDVLGEEFLIVYSF